MYTHKVANFPYHWHEDMEILFVLSDDVEIRVNQNSYKLREGDVFLINMNELHFISATPKNAQILVLQIDHEYVKGMDIQIEGKKFYLNSSDEQDNHKKHVFEDIKRTLASMMQHVLNRMPFYSIKIKQQLLHLVALLLEHFEVSVKTDQYNIEDDQRLLDILKYMNDHCKDPDISLNQVAEVFSLNPQYLSRYFKSKVGISFKKRLDSLRLQKSLSAVIATTKSINEIALEYGFPDSKAYYRVFKEVLGSTPNQYRQRETQVLQNDLGNYLSINSQESLSKLFKYLGRREGLEQIVESNPETTVSNLYGKSTKLNPSFRKLLTIGYAPHILREDFLEQLRQIQREMPFDYLRFHGIFSDELMIYNEKSDGTSYYNFNHMDTLLDNILSSGIKPFIEIGFMPKELAKSPDKIFWWEGYVSPPKEMNRWTDLIVQFMRHVINRYGIEEVRSWYFEFWNEPEVEGFFWTGSREEFFAFFAATYKCIKSIDPYIKVGGFGHIDFSDRQEWHKEFQEYAWKNGIELDFHSFHVYNTSNNQNAGHQRVSPNKWSISTENTIQDIIGRTSLIIGDEDNLTNKIDAIIKKQHSLKRRDFWITEWNSNFDSKDLLHDTCYMAAFIIKSVLENHNKVSGMGYWTSTDIFEEQKQEKHLFHGGFGLMTYNGIKKPAYHAMYFLSKLGVEIIDQGKDFILTKKGDSYQLLLFYYVHPNLLYRSFDYSELHLTDRDQVFEKKSAKYRKFIIQNLNGRYRVHKRFVNKKAGSSYDSWVDIGAPLHIEEEGVAYLKSRAEPGYEVTEFETTGDYTVECVLQQHEIQLFEFKKLY
nr:helix-turn-helix domain-containing protein [Terribacillus sp. AE2B 122]